MGLHDHTVVPLLKKNDFSVCLKRLYDKTGWQTVSVFRSKMKAQSTKYCTSNQQ